MWTYDPKVAALRPGVGLVAYYTPDGRFLSRVAAREGRLTAGPPFQVGGSNVIYGSVGGVVGGLPDEGLVFFHGSFRRANRIGTQFVSFTPPPAITEIITDDTSTEVAWAATPSQTYELQIRGTDGLWQTLGDPVTATEPVVRVRGASADSEGLFRVVRTR